MAYYPSSIAFYGYAKRTHVRPAVLRTVMACLLFCSLAHAVAAYQSGDVVVPHPVAQVSRATTHTLAAATGPQPAPASPAASPGSAAAAAGGLTSVPACVAAAGYTPPAALDLSTASNGLTEVVDRPAYYHVYGTSVAQIARELNTCAPHFLGTVAGANYLAYTSYHLSWQYDYLTAASGQCVLGDVKIGMHVSQIFPEWDSGSAASAALNAKWQSFIAALTYHESGHVALNTQYANKLLADLQALPPLDCNAVTSTVNATVNADVAALNAAHLQHDESTNYGATEGAVWQ